MFLRFRRIECHAFEQHRELHATQFRASTRSIAKRNPFKRPALESLAREPEAVAVLR